MNSSLRIWLLTLLAMLAFAANSLLCRLALSTTSIDPASFTTIRVVSGAIVLGLLTIARRRALWSAGSWGSALALFGYAIAFSYAYIALPAATGALLLFGAVQATMIGYGRWRGEKFQGRQPLGFALAIAGLAGLLLPGVTAPSPLGAALMLAAGVAWGVYSLRGRGRSEPTLVTASNFIRATPAAVLVSLTALPWMNVDPQGVTYALASGALTSGMGYVIWYAALPSLTSTTAASVQLSVPVLAALGGVLFLGEPLTSRLALATIAILGGVALVVFEGARARR